jgi:hypothetical protein
MKDILKIIIQNYFLNYFRSFYFCERKDLFLFILINIKKKFLQLLIKIKNNLNQLKIYYFKIKL